MPNNKIPIIERAVHDLDVATGKLLDLGAVLLAPDERRHLVSLANKQVEDVPAYEAGADEEDGFGFV